MRNVHVLEVRLLHPGNVITVARVNVLENRRAVDQHLPVTLERPHVDLHPGFGVVVVMQRLDLEFEIVERIAVLVAARAKHALEPLLHAPGKLALPPLLVLISVSTFLSFVVTFCNEIFTSTL